MCGCQLVCEALASLGGNRGDVLTPHLTPVLKLVQKLTVEAPLNAHKTKLMVSSFFIHQHVKHVSKTTLFSFFTLLSFMIH